jgi:hypothetical protein
MTTIHGPAADHAATTNPLAQLRAARHKPIAALIGATAGLVPVGVYEVGHYELTSWSPLECPKAVIVYAGLLFSALTVLGWSANMFGSKVKALGFTLLLEGIMMASSAAWLTAIALTYLVLINAAANGCRLALRDTVGPGVDWSSIARTPSPHARRPREQVGRATPARRPIARSSRRHRAAGTIRSPSTTPSRRGSAPPANDPSGTRITVAIPLICAATLTV